jgi:tRNA 2-selenouridine synthase SelU
MAAPEGDLLAQLLREEDDVEAQHHALQNLREKITNLSVGLDILKFLDEKASGVLVIDVRSPSEYKVGHIPGAVNVPLFDDAERALVGTCFHQRSQAEAMALGMALVRPKLPVIVQKARELLCCRPDGHAPAVADVGARQRVLVYCWRGGLRSGAIAWLLRLHGMDAITLRRGYKAFRAWVSGYWGDVEMPPKHQRQRERGAVRPSKSGGLGAAYGGAGQSLAAVGQAVTTIAPCNDSNCASSGKAIAESPVPRPGAGGAATAGADSAADLSRLISVARSLPGPHVCVIGGRTGVGKTKVLHALRARGQHVIDLEGLANHRGSTFGWVGGGDQPSTEHYHNMLAVEWQAIAQRAPGADGRRGWMFIEDEDSHVGGVSIPKPVYAALRCAPLVVKMHLPERARVQLLLSDYVSGHADGPCAVEWLSRMEASVAKLTKRLGGDRVRQLTLALRSRDFESVARAMLLYYDTLYDRHLANQGGTGSGSGTRPGVLAEVAPQEEDADFDADALAGLVLECVAKAEADGVGAMCRDEQEAAQQLGLLAKTGIPVLRLSSWWPGGAIVAAAAVLAIGLAGARAMTMRRPG